MRESRLVATGVWVLALVAIVFLLRAASQLLIPIVLAVLLTYALEPVVAWMHRRRVPRIAGAGVLLTAILASVAWGAYSLRDDTVQAVEALSELARRTRELMSSQGASRAGQRVREAAEELRRPTQSPSGDANQAGPPTGTSGPREQSGAASSIVTQWVQQGVRLRPCAGRSRQRHDAGGDKRPASGRLGNPCGRLQLDSYFEPVVVSGGLLLVGLVQFGDLMQAVKVSAAALAISSKAGC
jgi:hypothetical protein